MTTQNTEQMGGSTASLVTTAATAPDATDISKSLVISLDENQVNDLTEGVSDLDELDNILRDIEIVDSDELADPNDPFDENEVSADVFIILNDDSIDGLIAPNSENFERFKKLLNGIRVIERSDINNLSLSDPSIIGKVFVALDDNQVQDLNDVETVKDLDKALGDIKVIENSELSNELSDELISALSTSQANDIDSFDNLSTLNSQLLTTVTVVQQADLEDYASGNDITGGNGNDDLNGTAGNDTLNGGEGNDTLSGGEGDDILNGNDGEDSLSGGEGNDTLNGNAGNDTLNGGSNNDDLNGSNGNDLLIGNQGSDTLRGQKGDDTLQGEQNNDSLDGGSGADSLSGGGANDTLNGQQGNDSINGDGGNDSIDGGNEDDVLDGGGGKDTLTGGLGADTFTIAADTDTDVITDFLDGTDRLAVSGNLNYNQLKFEQRGADTVILQGNSATAPMLAILQNVTANSLSQDDFIKQMMTGDEEDNSLQGGAGDDEIKGLGGNDTLSGMGGSDTLSGGEGNDSINGDKGNDTLSGGKGNDAIQGSQGLDTINGGADNDSLSGGNDNDSLNGGSGNDTLNGGDGADTLNGENGTNELNGNNGDDSLTGGNGTDTLSGGNDNDTLIGGNGADILVGGNGADSLSGEGGTDTLEGNKGADTLSGGTGKDTLTGGKGNDQFVLALNQGADTITDFQNGKDLIKLDGGLSLGQLTIKQQGEDTRILANGSLLAILQDVQRTAIDNSDFISG